MAWRKVAELDIFKSTTVISSMTLTWGILCQMRKSINIKQQKVREAITSTTLHPVCGISNNEV